MSFILLLLLLAAGVFIYRWLTIMEKEIRAEIEAVDTAPSSGAPTEKLSQVKPAPDTDVIADQVLAMIHSHPDLLQKDIYALLPDLDKNQIQKMLIILDQSGTISRIRSGNTFKLKLLT